MNTLVRTVISLAVVVCVVGVVVGIVAIANMETVEAGYVGVLQDKPYFFGKGGVRGEVVVGPDRFFTWPSTVVKQVKVARQTLTIHAEDFMASDRVPLDFDVAVTILVAEMSQTPSLVRKYGTGALETFRLLVLQQAEAGKGQTGEFMSYLRDQIRHHHSSVFIAAQEEDGKLSDAAAGVEKATREHINAFLARNDAGMLQVANITLGRANPPEGVRKKIEDTAGQAQDIKTQRERKRAADERKVAEKAVAEADMAYVSAMGFSRDQYIELRRIEMMREACRIATCIFAPGTVPVALSPTMQSTGDAPAKAAAK